MDRTLIMGVQVIDREHAALAVQQLLTAHGCLIKTRLGLHDTGGDYCSSAGLILIEFVKGKDEEVDALEAELKAIEGVKIGRMAF